MSGDTTAPATQKDSKDSSGAPGEKLAKLAGEMETLDIEALAKEFVNFYEDEEKKTSLSNAHVEFQSYPEDKLKEQNNKQIGQIVVSAEIKGLPAKGTPLLIFSSNSVEAAKIDPKQKGLDMKLIKEIQQEHFINFLTFQANKASKKPDTNGKIQPITIQAIGFNLDELSQLVEKIRGQDNIVQNITIELPPSKECKCTQEEYDKMQKMIDSLKNPATQTASFGTATDPKAEQSSDAQVVPQADANHITKAKPQ